MGTEPIEQSIIASTRADHINVRLHPNIDSEIIEILTSDKVYIVGRNYDATWILVTYAGISPFDRDTWIYGVQPQIGWVAGYLLTKPDNLLEEIPIVER